MIAFRLGEGSGRFWSTRRSTPESERRFRGKKAAIEAIRRKKQSIDATMSRLLAEVSEVQQCWGHRSALEADKLTSVVARAQIMHVALARVVATVEHLSIFGLNACGADLESAASLLSRLRMEVRVSAARAVADDQGSPGFIYQSCKLSA